ncbi:MAG: transcriptional repressor NrdR [Alphaproteobacteria bacterium]|nr:transcriptional repressor NrdR [Alphaproteobacteria bacterium]
MKCPFCGKYASQVKDSRPSDDGTSIRRRRICSECGGRFTTFEYVQSQDLIVVKKNDVRVPFEREKLYRSIQLALRKREVDEEIIDQIVAGIIQSLEEKGMVEIRSNEIGELVMNALLKIDKVAYVRYASVYKNFTTMEDFKDFAAKLMEGEE